MCDKVCINPCTATLPPELSLDEATLILVLNIAIPGLGTMIAASFGHRFRWDRFLVGYLQLILWLAVVGFVWSVWWGIAAFGNIGKPVREAESEEREERGEREEREEQERDEHGEREDSRRHSRERRDSGSKTQEDHHRADGGDAEPTQSPGPAYPSPAYTQATPADYPPAEPVSQPTPADYPPAKPLV